MHCTLKTGPLDTADVRVLWTRALDSLRAVADPSTDLGNLCRVTTAPHQVFLDIAWLDATAACLPGQFELFVCAADEAAQSPLWLAALHVQRRGPFRIVEPVPFAPYSSVVAASQQEYGQMEKALRSRFDRIRIHYPPQADPPDSADWSRYPLKTFVAPLGEQEALASYWSSNPARTLAKYGPALRTEESPAFAVDVARLVSASYRRHGRRPRAPESLIERMVETAAGAGISRTFGTRDADGRVVAAVAFLTSGESAYYWIAGSEPGPGMTVLLASALPALHRDGMRAFDFVGANTPSIAEFKRRFGSRLVDYTGAIATPARTLAFAERLRSLVRR